MDAADDKGSFEARLLALETAVARLSSALEPEFAVSRIAAPVAGLIIREASQHRFVGRFFALLDIGETLIKYSAALAFASVAADPEKRAEILELFLRPPTLGTMVDMLRRILDGPQEAQWPIPILREVFRRANSKPTPTARYLFEEFISLRNSDKGHGALQAEGYYEDRYMRHCVSVQDCVARSTHLQLPLIRIDEITSVGDRSTYNATRLMGAAPVRLPQSLVMTKGLSTGATCLWDQGEQVLVLDDFVSYRYCSHCGQEHIFFAERITHEKTSYHSVYANHRIETHRARS